MKLWYANMASKWEEALPIGNGRLGGMVFGGLKQERIQLNEDTLWSGEPKDTLKRESNQYLKKARDLIFQGKYAEAEKLIEEKLVGEDCEAYQPLGDLMIEHQFDGTESNYRRELNLQTGITKTQYTIGKNKFVRETFVSYPDQVMVVNIKADDAQLSDYNILLDSPHKNSVKILSDDRFVLQGRSPISVKNPNQIEYAEDRGLQFQIYLQVLMNDGQLKIEEDKLHISGSKDITLLLTAKTNFEKFNKVPDNHIEDVETQCKVWLENAARLSYEELKERHLVDYQNLFNRVELFLGGSEENESNPTDIRLKNYQQNRNDVGLEALYFQYGRYLLITGSRPGTQTANLQGIWNQHVTPPWNSDYTTNINVEMNYWPAEACNLSECHEPLFDMIEDLSVSGERTAKELYGAKGYAVHHNVDLWRMSTPTSGQASWAFWPMAGAWLASHLWERYLYSLDEAFLKERAYRLMKGAAEFCLDWLIEGPNGYLVTNPSTSPENKFITSDGEPCAVSYASTMDMTLIRELFTNCMKASEILNMDEQFRNHLTKALDRLVPFQINKDGLLQEWVEDFPEHEPGHRHVSHLYGLFPSNQINEVERPDLVEAAKKSLQRRLENGGGHTGWSCAWLINLFARLKDGEKAYSYVQTLLARSTHPNLFDDHPPFQIDGNFGGTAGIAEMLVQSHLEQIELLPALPGKWHTGSVKGLKARGGFEVDIEWEKGQLKKAVVTAQKSSVLRIKYDSQKLELTKSNGTVHIGDQIALNQNEKITISIA